MTTTVPLPRRTVLRVALVASLLGCTLPLARAEAPDAHEAARLEARWRQRRIIQNNDGGESRVPPRKIVDEADFLSLRATPLLGSQVDTIVYDTTAGTFGRFAHRTRAGERFLETQGRYQHNLLPHLQRLGTDPLAIMIRFAKTHGIEIFWGVRMNDTHDKSNPLLLPELKKERPDLLLGARGIPQHGQLTAVNYAKAEIRERMFGYVKEVADGYDVDGIELDFFRHPVFFPGPAFGGTATDADRAAMSGLVERIAAHLKARSRERGRPLLLSVRVPDSLEFNRAIGLDLERWLKEGWVDLLVTTCYFRLNPWSYSVQLGHRYGVPVYPCLSESRISSTWHPFARRGSAESYRARAAKVWQAGADGVYLFNSFNGQAPWWRELGSPATVMEKPRRYFVSIRGKGAERFLAGGEAYDHLFHLSPEEPLLLKDGKPAVIPLEVGDEEGKPATLRLNLSSSAGDLEVRLNGTPLEPLPGELGWRVYAVAPGTLKTGKNRLELLLHDRGEKALFIGESVEEALKQPRWTLPSGRVAISAMEVRLLKGEPGLKIRLLAGAGSGARIEYASVRMNQRAGLEEAPAGFYERGGYVYPANWEAPGVYFARGKRELEWEVPIDTEKPGFYVLRVVLVGSRKGQMVRDDRLIHFRIGDGAIHLFSTPSGLRDLHLEIGDGPGKPVSRVTSAQAR
ncbi:MAG TPA: hypothetical protein VNQ90_16715 [Chthoniobacteraceae bacterium]|nr:hypothetical protein [Chthoniobacteraceae bacterium]